MAASQPHMTDVLVVGGGVVGLSLAWELARRDVRVTLVDRAPFGRAASWAGAGILPPPPGFKADHPLDELARLSYRLHPVWAAQLKELTGVDTGYRQSGGLYLARRPGELASLLGSVESWVQEGLSPQRLDDAQLAEIEPGLANVPAMSEIRASFWFPEEAQLRNPRHLQALVAACRLATVDLFPEHPVHRLVPRGSHWEAEAGSVKMNAARVCVTSGAWSSLLLEPLGIQSNVIPIRGQMLLFQVPTPPLRTIINEGPRYLVPRDDGHVLVGSTEEEAGFDASTTPSGLAGLQGFAESWLPELSPVNCIDRWAGLRPASVDGFPYLGQVPDRPGLYLAAGHFRSGLYLSPGTAEVMADLLTGQTPAIDTTPFRIQRGLHRAN